MSLFDGYDISTSGMVAQRTRVKVLSTNIANAQTTHTPEGGPYVRKKVIFEDVLQHAKEKPDLNGLAEVKVRAIVNSKAKPFMKFEPDNPDANKDGYVAYPNVNPVIEMVDLLEATKSYEANASAFKSQRDIDTKTLDILKA